ncbi:MAG TPA: AAA family ATPase [Negativicutes bacterium]
MHYKEISVGVTGGILLFLIWSGIDIVPLLFIGVFIGAVLFLNQTRLRGKTFATFQQNTATQLVQFDDIGGQEVAKNELREALEFIINIERLQQLGIRPLKGLLLSGPPGTGKTLLAKAAAEFTGSAFVAASGSEFVEMYVGVGAQRIRQLFQQARNSAQKQQKQSAVIFIDEIETLGGKRGQASGNLEYDQTLNELLVQMDGLSGNDSIRLLIIGATNRADILDSALLRPGRFDRQVKVDLPDKQGRLHILKLHTRNKPLADDVSLEEIAIDTFGFSGAHLESLTNEAAIMALREEQDKITITHLKNAIDKVIMGEKLDRLPNKQEKRRIAVHEAGHALLSEITKPGSVATINVTSRSNALGYVRQTQREETYLHTLDDLKGKIAVGLAGSLAEELHLGNRSTGAANDFKQAAELAKQIIFSGMSELGVVSPEDLPKELLHSTITSILQETETYARSILTIHQSLLATTSEMLLQQECITGKEFQNMLLTAQSLIAVL